tara:strand:+ start:508 stop:1038 length:531 start_codon:yes stop_codon:yes gene_type:complete
VIQIIAETVKGKNKTHFIVSVVEGDTVLDQETATTINKRDELIWNFAERFNTTDIHIIIEIDEPKAELSKKGAKPKSKTKFKFSEIPSIPVLDMSDASDFFEDNEDIVYNRVIVAVREGIESSRDIIRMFELNGTGVYLTSERSDWKPGLENAEKYFLGREEYEKCAVCVELLTKL